MAKYLTGLSSVLNHVGDDQGCLAALEEALAVKQRLYEGKPHIEVASTLRYCNLVVMLMTQGRGAHTRFWFCCPPNGLGLMVPELCRHLALVQESLGATDKAAELLSRAEDMEAKAGGTPT